MILRITTERKHIKWLCKLIGNFFPGFTVYKTIGYWQGKREKSIVFEIDTIGYINAHLLDANIKLIVRKICGYNRQECVLVQKIESDSQILSGGC